MRVFRIRFLAFALVMIGMGGMAFAANSPVKIMPFGDSLTAGGYVENGVYKTGVGYRQELYELLNQSHFQFHFVGSFQDGPANFPERSHEGHAGWRIDQIGAQATQWVKAAQPNVVLLLIGTNDCIQNYDLGHAMDRLSTLVQKIKVGAPWVQIFLATNPPLADPAMNSRIDSYNKDLRNWVNQSGDPAIQLVEMHDRISANLLFDGVHPTTQGYQLMGQVWFSVLAPAFNLP